MILLWLFKMMTVSLCSKINQCCLHNLGLLRLFCKKCVSVPFCLSTFVCLYNSTYVGKYLRGKYSLCTRNKNETIPSLVVNFGVNMGFFSELQTVCGDFESSFLSWLFWHCKLKNTLWDSYALRKCIPSCFKSVVFTWPKSKSSPEALLKEFSKSIHRIIQKAGYFSVA